MAPHPYSDGSSVPNEMSLDNAISLVQDPILAEDSSPSSVSAATTPSPVPQGVIQVEVNDMNNEGNNFNLNNETPCFPSVGDIMPYDHSLPDFIRQITNQPNLANVQSLSLRVISTLISLHRISTYLPNLRELDLEGSVLNSLRDIGCSLKNLHILKVGRCQLESLDGTFGLSTLRELYAQNNLIIDVTPCSNLPHIRHIDLSGNRIRNISYAGFLSVCNKLKSIAFAGNPVAEVADYRKNVQMILPQIEYLDGEPFSCEEWNKEIKRTENYCEESDSSSTEVPDFLFVSPSDSMNNLFEPEEDLFFIDKKNKHAINITNQNQLEAGDYEVQELFPDCDSPENYKNISSLTTKAKGVLMESIKITQSKNTITKHKFISIQKLDKDIENKSKKSNCPLTASFSDEFLLNSDNDPESTILCNTNSNSTNSSINKKEKNILSALDGLMAREEHTNENKPVKKEIKKPPTDVITNVSSLDISHEIKSGAIKKRTSTSVFKHTELDMQDKNDSSWGISKLTSGSPICGNLTVALRNRKKFNESWNDERFNTPESLHLLAGEKEKIKDLQDNLNGSGDNVNAGLSVEKEHFIGQDVLMKSQQWRESFRHYRSTNRSKWEEDGTNF